MIKIQDIFGLFDIDIICDDLYNALHDSLLEFSKTKDNKDVYAICVSFSCETGNVWLRYMNKSLLKKFCDRYPSELNYCDEELYGLKSSKYNIGNFKLMNFKQNDNLLYFYYMYYFFSIKHYYGDYELPNEFRTLDNSASFEIKLFDYDDIPPYAELIVPDDKKSIYSELKLKYIQMIRDIVLKVVLRLKENITFINKTNDFIIFNSDCEESTSFNYELMLKTIDNELLDKFLDKKNTY